MLKFKIRHQQISRVDSFRPVAKSVNYLYAEFDFLTSDWDGTEKKAVCKNISSSQTYDSPITDNKCLIPWEAISEKGSFELSVLGTIGEMTITASVVTVELGRTLPSGIESNPPTPTEFDLIKQDIANIKEQLEQGDVSEEKITQIVNDYLTNNPPTVTETDPTVSDWAKQPEKPAYTADEVGALSEKTLSGAVDKALEKAKESGEFDGQDYLLTEDDKIEIAEMAAGMVEIPDTEVPVKSVNGKTGAVQLSAADVKARADTWMPTAQDVGALPDTYTPPNQTAEQVGADPAGTAQTAVSQHNVSTDSHSDIRLALKAINDRLNAFFDTDDQTLDELSEIVAFIVTNKSLIDAITTSKVSVSDIVNNLTTNVTNRPLSAAQGVILKGLIDTVSNSLSNYQPYVRTEAETVGGIVNQHQSSDSIIFPFLSDAHCGYYLDTENETAKLAGQLLNLIGMRVPYDFIVNGGDMSAGAWDTTREKTYEHYEDYTELTAEAHKGIPTVWVPGNHDDAPYMATADRATQKDVFALTGRKNRVSGAICPNGCNYGYLDLENRKLRVIYLDTDDKRSWGTVQVGASDTAPAYLNAHNVGGNQLRWLADTGLDFTDKENPAGWSIVVVSHVALNISGTITDAVSGTVYANNTTNAATILNAYRTGKSGSITHNDITIDYDFSAVESKATVICAVHGHNHKFCSEMLTGGILSIGCPNIMNGRERVSDDGKIYTKTAGTADGTSFCILTIDRENLKIYVDCVGVGYDREFAYTTEVVSYTNQLPISTDANGNVYNSKGWKENTYLSSGNEGSRADIFTTGFIPIVPNEYGTAYFYFKNVGMQTGQDSHRLCVYNADKSFADRIFKTTVTGPPFSEYGADGNISIITLTSTNFEIGGFIRLCCGYLGEDSIITSNEPID